MSYLASQSINVPIYINQLKTFYFILTIYSIHIDISNRCKSFGEKWCTTGGHRQLGLRSYTERWCSTENGHTMDGSQCDRFTGANVLYGRQWKVDKSKRAYDDGKLRKMKIKLILKNIIQLDTVCRVLLDRKWTVGELAAATLSHARDILTADSTTIELAQKDQCIFDKIIGIWLAWNKR